MYAENTTSTAWWRALNRLQGAYSPETLRGYRSDYFFFSGWCERLGASAFPADPQAVSAYLEHESARLKPSTLRRHLNSIGRVHQLSGFADPTSHPDVFLALRRASRANLARPKQALGLTGALIARLKDACGADLQGLRDQALLGLGFETLCRASELVNLAVEDFRPSLRGSGSILIRRGKADFQGNGRLIVLSRATAEVARRWLEAARIRSGAIFRPVIGTEVMPRGLRPRAVTRILRSRAHMAGLSESQVRRISGHSLRVGAAQQLTMNDCDLLQVMRAGGWRTITTVSRYIENAEASLWE